MPNKIYTTRMLKTPFRPDRTLYVATFTGYRMHAFGRDQILDYTAEIHVYQTQTNPPVWVAEERQSRIKPFESHRAEDTMRLVAEGFTTCLEPWQTFEIEPLGRVVKLGPKLVKTKRPTPPPHQ
jgi:hypothetical protein